MLNWKSFSTLNKGQKKNYMTQIQTKKAVRKSMNDGNDPEKNTLKEMQNIPKQFEYKLINLNSVVGWSKSLDGLLFTSVFSGEY